MQDCRGVSQSRMLRAGEEMDSRADALIIVIFEWNLRKHVYSTRNLELKDGS